MHDVENWAGSFRLQKIIFYVNRYWKFIYKKFYITLA